MLFPNIERDLLKFNHNHKLCPNISPLQAAEEEETHKKFCHISFFSEKLNKLNNLIFTSKNHKFCPNISPFLAAKEEQRNEKFCHISFFLKC